MKYLIVVAWLLISFFNFGFINAHDRATIHYCSTVTPRESYAASALFALMPIGGTVIAVFATGFMEHGWSLRLPKCHN